MLAAIPHSGFILGFAAEELRNKKSFVLQAVKINGYALMGASDVGLPVGGGKWLRCFFFTNCHHIGLGENLV